MAAFLNRKQPGVRALIPDIPEWTGLRSAAAGANQSEARTVPARSGVNTVG